MQTMKRRKAEDVHFPSYGRGNVTLEGAWYEGGENANIGAVFCHPHPLYGATMDHPVVFHVANVFRDHGWSALRFNFRGAGQSTGKYGDGITEVGDVIGAVNWLKDRGAERVLVGGYSFGAAVTLRAILTGKVDADYYLGVALPSQEYFPGTWELEGTPNCPSLFVGGETDYMYDSEAVANRFESDSNRCVVIPDADHFFSQRHNREDLTALVQDFVLESAGVNV